MDSLYAALHNPSETTLALMALFAGLGLVLWRWVD